MSKILIASLGSGKRNEKGEYRKTTYSIGTEIGEVVLYKNKNFVTSAIEKHYKIDKTFYIGTVGSMWENLYAYYCNELGIEKDLDYEMELYEITSNANKDSELTEIDINKFNKIFNGKVEIILTKYGMNSEQIFESFNNIMKIGDELKDGDEIYLDITHSFRSNAMWMFLVMNYIKDVLDKNIEIKMISFGIDENGEEKLKIVLEYDYDEMIIETGNKNEILEILEEFVDACEEGYELHKGGADGLSKFFKS